MYVDQREKTRSAMSQAILARAGKARQDGENPWRGYRLSELARASIELAGGRTAGMDPSDIARLALSVRMAGGMQTTSDFPNVLEDVMHKMVLDGYNAAPTTWRLFCAEGTVTDLREWAQLVPGLLGNLLPVDEHGNYDQIAIPDAEKNTIQAQRRGRIIAVTPDTLINDDLGYISDQANAAGQMGARTIEHNVYTLLASNPTLADGNALFSANHANLGTGGDPDVATLQEADTLMNAQTAPQVTGEDAQLLDVSPYAVVAHRSRRATLVTLNEAKEVYDADSGEKIFNAVNGMFERVVTSSRLAAAPWYVFANPLINPVIKVVFLNGQTEPAVAQSEHFESGGIRWRIELPHGVGAVDYRGGVMNVGS